MRKGEYAMAIKPDPHEMAYVIDKQEMRKGEYAMAIKPDPHEMALQDLADVIDKQGERIGEVEIAIMRFDTIILSLLNELTDDTLTLASLFSELEARVSKLLDEIEGVKERVASLERISKIWVR
jgi:hypothetical protein